MTWSNRTSTTSSGRRGSHSPLLSVRRQEATRRGASRAQPLRHSADLFKAPAGGHPCDEKHPQTLTAYHEAGHAVVAVYYILSIERVSIVEDDECDGHVASYSPLRHLQEIRSDPMRIERALRRRFQFCVAGAEAVRLIAPRLALNGTQGDYSDAAECLFGLSSVANERDALNALLCAETRNLIAH